MEIDALFRPSLYFHFSPSDFNNLEMGGSSGNPSVSDEGKVKRKSPPTTSASERATKPPKLLRGILVTQIEQPPKYVFVWTILFCIYIFIYIYFIYIYIYIFIYYLYKYMCVWCVYK